MNRLVVIGEIVRPHGLRGEVRVTPLTDDPERFQGLTRCWLWDRARDHREPCRITGVRRQGTALILALDRADSADAARALAGRLIALPASEALPPGPGRFYPWELEGCQVITDDGREVGRVVGVEPSPAHDLWVVGDGQREHLIPAVPEIVVDLDLAARRVVIRPPEGLLEL